MTSLNCLIVDDEPVARKILREYIEDITFLNLVAEAEHPIAANNILQRQSIDLVFLDIQMPRVNGIEFLKKLVDPPLVIMTTAYPDYALQGFELDVLDYLVKPIGNDRFLKAVNKANDYYGLRNKSADSVIDDFFIRSNQKIEKILMKEVLYIEGLSNYLCIHTTVRKFISHLTIKGIEEGLPNNQFVRIHKSYLVSVNAIQSVDGQEVKLSNKQSLPLSKHFKDEVMETLSKRLIKR